MLYFIGIGLADEKDITFKGLEALKSCEVIYLEDYTNVLSVSFKKLEEFYGKKIILANRDLVEKRSNEILDKAKTGDVAFLIIGDIFAATTHVDLLMRAKKEKVDVKFIHNASILTAVGVVGLDLYKYGRITSIPFDHENIRTPLNVLKDNQSLGMHTLFLLDLDPKNKKFLTINEACKYLISKGIDKNILSIGCTSIGTQDKEVKVGSIECLSNYSFLKYPQCLIIPGKLHFVEEEMIEQWK